MSEKLSLVDQARKDRAAAEAAGDLGLVLFIDGFIAGAIEMKRERDWQEEFARSLESGFGIAWEDDDNGTD